jgi:hypothetical protein
LTITNLRRECCFPVEYAALHNSYYMASNRYVKAFGLKIIAARQKHALDREL